MARELSKKHVFCGSTMKLGVVILSQGVTQERWVVDAALDLGEGMYNNLNRKNPRLHTARGSKMYARLR